jgi:hypothetical protein
VIGPIGYVMPREVRHWSVFRDPCSVDMRLQLGPDVSFSRGTVETIGFTSHRSVGLQSVWQYFFLLLISVLDFLSPEIVTSESAGPNFSSAVDPRA